MKGIFITFEGTEGSGKTTQIRFLSSHLRKKGYSVVVTREPGGTSLGEKVRRLLLSVTDNHLAHRTELYLYLSSRAQHVSEVILPSLREGKIVLCDRFSDATMAYQVFGRGLSRSFVSNAIRFAAQDLKPHLTLLLDLDIRTGLSRVLGRGRSNRIDREDIRFHGRVRKGYLALARNAPRRFRVINARMNSKRVARSIQSLTDRFLERQSKRT